MDVGALTIAEIIEYASRIGVVSGLLLIVVGGIRKWYVFGWYYEALEKERNEWRRVALSQLQALQQSQQLAESNVQLAERGTQVATKAVQQALITSPLMAPPPSAEAMTS